MKKICILMSIAAVLAVSCSGDVPDGGAFADAERPISLMAGIEGERTLAVASAEVATRGVLIDGATAGTKAVLTGMTFFRKDATTNEVQTNFSGCSPLIAGRTDTGGITFGTPQFYNQNGEYASFVGFWPGTTMPNTSYNSGTVTWAVQGDQDVIISTTTPSKSFNAGNYSSPSTASVTFEHVLARLQITCKVDAAVAQDVARSAWGKITKIEIIQSAADAVYNASTNAVSYATARTLSLWLPNYSAKLETQGYNLLSGSSAITAEGMYAPSAGAIQLKVYSEKVTAGRTVNVQLKDGSGIAKDFVRGMTHQVTLTFGANNKEIGVATSDISAWAVDGTGVSDEVLIPVAVALEYDNAITSGMFNTTNYAIPTAVKTTYNNMPLSSFSNKLTVAEAMAVAPPYYKFEVAPQDEVYPNGLQDEESSNFPYGCLIYNWYPAWNACKAKAPAGKWRMPWLSELMLIHLNRDKLNAVSGFTPLTSDYYWSAQRENTQTGYIWSVNYGTGNVGRRDFVYPAEYCYVRCIRELP